MNQRRRPEGNQRGVEGGDRRSGGSDKGWGRGHQLPTSLWESLQAGSQPSTNAHLEFMLGPFTQALSQTLTLEA